ncbi:MAG: nucleotidyl transferase AbiEii/AbiGii toxin family protein [Polyangiales bacterium]
MARVVEVLGAAATLKGGLVLELRLARARTTKDVDLRMTGTPVEALAKLQQAGRLDLGDYLSFEVQPDRDHPEIQNDGMKYDGLRFRALCKLAGKLYGQTFGVDVAFGDPIMGEPDVIVAEDVLSFAGIRPPTLRVYPIETHVAEKLHAYTMPRVRPNSRVKDLPDIALLATVKAIDARRLRAALEQTFSFRGTHVLPTALPAPPQAWSKPYEVMARDNGLPWVTLIAVHEAASAFLDAVLASALDATWRVDSWNWEAHDSRRGAPRTGPQLAGKYRCRNWGSWARARRASTRLSPLSSLARMASSSQPSVSRSSRRALA